MAESSRCPFCNVGTVVWILNDDLYFLKCTHCEASGRYSVSTEQINEADCKYEWIGLHGHPAAFECKKCGKLSKGFLCNVEI